MKAEGKTSKAPLRESLRPVEERQDRAAGAVRPGRRPGRGLVHGPVLRAVLPDSSAQGRRHHRQHADRRSLLIGTPFFIVFGWLSDKIGRKPIILAGCLIAALTYFPLFKALTKAPTRAGSGAGIHQRPVTVRPIQAECSFQFNPVGTEVHQLLRHRQAALAGGGAYRTQAAPAGTPRHDQDRRASVIASFEGAGLSATQVSARPREFKKRTGKTTLATAGYPDQGRPGQIDNPWCHAADSPGDLRDHGLRPDRGHGWWKCSRPASATPR
jgi:hypothetical protein